MKQLDAGLVWLRRDLRIDDHAALYHALRDCRRVWCAFVFDRDILDALPSRLDRRVEFIRDSLDELDGRLRAAGGGLIVLHARAAEAIPRLAARLGADAVFVNRDYEPAAVARDAQVAEALARDGCMLVTFKDQALFDRDEVVTGAGRPYAMFTPYRNSWERLLAASEAARAWPVEAHLDALAPLPAGEAGAMMSADAPLAFGVPSLESIGFARTNLAELPLGTGESGAQRLVEAFAQRIGHYAQAREIPSVRGSSLLSVHLRFGTVSTRRLARLALEAIEAAGGRLGDPAGEADAGARTWLSELAWRDFFFQLLHHMPHTVDRACKPQFEAVRFEQGPRAEALLAAWKAGATGYPLVDAGMRQLAATGFMHNRVRMVVASFLCKHLGLHWKAGERHFADALNDYDLSANVGNWQWAASTGCDAQPWFRIFNPVTQSQKFDPAGRYIRRWVPELARLPDRVIHAPWAAGADALHAAGVRLGKEYPAPVVDHEEARARTLARYAVVKQADPGAA